MENLKPKKNRLWISIIGILLISALAGFEFLRFLRMPVINADAGFKKATNTIDPEELRAWALKNIRNKASRKEVAETMPKSLRELYEYHPDAGVNGSTLYLMWGGGFLHWGFFIGETNDTMPFVSNNPEYPYNFEWKPGMYYTREANFKKLQ